MVWKAAIVYRSYILYFISIRFLLRRFPSGPGDQNSLFHEEYPPFDIVQHSVPGVPDYYVYPTIELQRWLRDSALFMTGFCENKVRGSKYGNSGSRT